MGLGPAGYSLRIAETISLPSRSPMILASVQESITLPADIKAAVCDKSSWARRGLSVYNTKIQPGWSGFLTLELRNDSDVPISLIRGMGICEIEFHLLDKPSQRPYQGRYQNQSAGPQPAKG